MSRIILICISVFLVILPITCIACTQPPAESQEKSQRIALEFAKSEATYQFDGMPETLKMISATSMGDGWKYTVEFDSRHGGYGDRNGQALDLVITHHRAEIIVQNGKVTKAIMDQQWDMINQRIDVEIKLAPIDEVRVYTMKSNPPQIGVYIKGGLPDGCTTFHDIETSREGNTINIKVSVQHPKGVSCPAIYTNFEKDINLGSDFTFGTTYTLNVNDYSTTFGGTLMKGEGFAIYLTRDDIPPEKMEMLSHVDIADQPIISLQDIITYNAQTHELKLTDTAFKRVSQLQVPTRGKSFLVCVDKNPVYWGAFWTPVSSQSFDGVTIWQPYSLSKLYIITLELGYPSSSFYGGEDPRNKPEIISAFEKAGKLINALTISEVDTLPSSMKGYELYSWQENDGWHFTLITGTNRNKTQEEIISGEYFISETGWVNIHCTGVEAIKAALGKVPSGQWVSWRDGAFVSEGDKLTLPPQDIIDNVKDYAVGRGLNFYAPTPGQYKQITLITGGYGYEVGDIVLVDRLQEPKLGDIVQYDWRLNNSDCMAMGPGLYLTKVIGIPGDKVKFEAGSYFANGFTGSLPADIPTMWGSIKYADVTNMPLIVPDGEYLADKWVGQECSGTDKNGSSTPYNRFTIKSEAITGVILEKIGHDQEFEDAQKNIVY